MKPLGCGFHLSFQHFMNSFLWSIRLWTMENFVVDLLNITILWMDNIKKKTEFFEKKIIIIKTRHWLFTISRQLAQSALVCQHLYATVCNFCNMYSSVVQCSVYCHCHTVNLRTHFKYCENAVLHRFLFLFCRREQRSLQ